MKKILLIGIGNKGRGDDGLGWAFADRFKEADRFEVVYRYQLQIEDAELISQYERVWFVDASHQVLHNGFSCERLKGEGRFNFTTHSLHPEAVVQLCHQLFQRRPETHLLGISGADFELGHGMSPAAVQHLDEAFNYFVNKMELQLAN